MSIKRSRENKTKRYFSDNQTRIYTFKECRELIIKVKQIAGVSFQTERAYHRIFNDLDKYFGQDTNVTTLTEDDARDYIDWNLHEKIPYENSSRQDLKHQKGISVKTVNNYLIMASAAFNVLEQRGITDNIFLNIDQIKEDEKAIETLTVTEINQLFKAFDKRIYTEFREYVACHVMLDGFSRIGETLDIKISDIDFDKKSVTFTKTKGRRVRTIPLSNESIKLLEELINENEESESEHVFLTVFGERLDTDTFRKHLNQIVDRSGIKTNVYPHIFRHTASKMYIEKDGNLRILQLILGHASSHTTERYAHVLDSTVKEYLQVFSPIRQLKKKAKTRTSRIKK